MRWGGREGRSICSLRKLLLKGVVARCTWFLPSPQISASSMLCFRHGSIVWLLLVSSPWKHPAALPSLGVDAFRWVCQRSRVQVLSLESYRCLLSSTTPNFKESLLPEGRKSFFLHGSGTNSFLHSTFLLTLGLAFMNKIQEDSRHLFHFATFLPMRTGFYIWNWNGMRRKIQKEKNNIKNMKIACYRKKGRNRERNDLSSSSFSEAT